MVVLVESQVQECLNEHREKWEDIDPNYIAEDLNDGINWLLNK